MAARGKYNLRSEVCQAMLEKEHGIRTRINSDGYHEELPQIITEDANRCGTHTGYNYGCRNSACRDAWRERRKHPPEPEARPCPHAFDLPCLRPNPCRRCELAEMLQNMRRDAEDRVFAHEDRISSHKLRQHGTVHGANRGCKCPECRLAAAIKKARQRGKSTARHTKRRVRLAAERETLVLDWLEEHEPFWLIRKREFERLQEREPMAVPDTVARIVVKNSKADIQRAEAMDQAHAEGRIWTGR